MPLDFTMLLGASPPAATFVPYEVVPSPFDDPSGLLGDSEPPYACRRVATFPMVNGRYAPKPSNLKYRSLSESADLHKLQRPPFVVTTISSSDSYSLVDFKRDLHMLLEDEHGVGNDQQQQSSQQLLLNGGGKGCENGAGPSSSPTPDESNNNSTDDENRQQKKSNRKKVVFADDRGFQLTTVRFMTEPSDVPPKINPAVIRALLGDQYDEEADRPSATWTINFKQPASEYIAFRQKLDTSFVSVENVLVKNEQSRLVGTVKVKNLSFEKQVYIRLSDNEWKSYFDRTCKYSSNRCGDQYDTFQFDFEIPYDDSAHQRIEFCVCYKTDNTNEYWDNNDGKNYEIISEQLRLQRLQEAAQNGNGNGKEKEEKENGRRYYGKPIVDALALNCTNWTEFASWSDLSTHGPYW